MSKKASEATLQRVRRIHRGRVFDLYRETVTLPNGETASLEVIRHPGAAAVVPLLDESHLILIRQYRHALRETIWEIPAGTLNGAEDPLHCARRELEEETGYRPGVLHRLGEVVPVPGYSDERVHLFLAEELKQVTQDLDADEVLEVEVVPWREAMERMGRGEIKDAKTIVGLVMARTFLAKGEASRP